MILSAHHTQITVPCGSEIDAKKFYCGLLGLQEIPKPGSLADRGGFWLQLGDFQVHVSLEDGIERSTSKAHVAYLVDDLKRWRKRLRDSGIEILDGIPIPGYSRFEFRDPFGNRVEFLQADE